MIKYFILIVLLAICASAATRQDTLSSQVELATKYLRAFNDEWSGEYARGLAHADPVYDDNLLPALKSLAKAATQTRILGTAIQAAANAMMNSTQPDSIIKTGMQAFYNEVWPFDV